MKARKYVAIEPLQEAPTGPDVDPTDRAEALLDALRGVELGAYDNQAIGWLIMKADQPILRTLVSLFERTRSAGAVDLLDAQSALRRHVEELGLPRPGDTQGRRPSYHTSPETGRP
jgi:hypothetical protein